MWLYNNDMNYAWIRSFIGDASLIHYQTMSHMIYSLWLKRDSYHADIAWILKDSLLHKLITKPTAVCELHILHVPFVGVKKKLTILIINIFDIHNLYRS